MNKQYVDNLTKTLESHSNVEDWRFLFSEASSIGVGRDLKGVGGPYSPPTTKSGLDASLYVRWKDGRVSEGSFEPHHFDDLSSRLKTLEVNAREDPDAPRVLSPQEIPNVKIYDQQVADLLTNPGYLFEIMDMYGKLTSALGTQNVEASVKVGVIDTVLRASTGMDYATMSTSMATRCDVGGRAFDGDGSRSLLKRGQVQEVLDIVSQMYLASGKKVEVPSAEVDVLFSPTSVSQLLSTFVLSNLSGQAVAENESAFSADEFREGRKLFGENVSYVINGSEDFELGSAPFSSEGVPVSNPALISEGRLVSPLLSVKYADKLGMTPTGPGISELIVPNVQPLDEVISGIGSGVYIDYLAGMHTQVGVSGKYATQSGAALAIKDGQLVGRTKVSISGSFFEDLNNPEKVFAARESRPKDLAMKVRRNVKWMPE